MVVEYRSNNSGGYWWLDDDQWRKLEASGWNVAWVKDNPKIANKPGEDRWLGALATKASKEFPTTEDAITEWSSVTGLDPGEMGCECCGRPHQFYEEDDEEE